MARRRLMTWALVALLTAGSAGWGGSAARGDELSSKLQRVLIGLKSVVDQRRETTLAVGDITADPSLAASGGPAIANAMIEALGTFGIKVSRKARLAVRGRYKLVKEPASGLNSLRIDLTLSDRVDEKDVTEVSIHVVDASTIARLAGGTGDISGATRKEQSDKVERALNEPTTKVDTRPDAQQADTRISAGPGVPYAIEVQVKVGPNDYRPRAATIKEDQAFVPLGRGEIYGILLINDSDLAAGVELAIDGLEIFAFSENPADVRSRIVVRPKSTARVIGWYRNNGPQGSNEFLVARAAEAAAAKQLPASSARLGMITATFAAAWPRSEPPPPGESTDDTARGDLGTALGAKTDQKMTPVDFLVGKPRAVVTVRYDKPVEPADLPGQ